MGVVVLCLWDNIALPSYRYHALVSIATNRSFLSNWFRGDSYGMEASSYAVQARIALIQRCTGFKCEHKVGCDM